MRISTKQIYTQGIEAFQQQQQKLAKLQEQISSGVKLNKPSDDPAAASRVLELEQEVSVNLQYQATREDWMGDPVEGSFDLLHTVKGEMADFMENLDEIINK